MPKLRGWPSCVTPRRSRNSWAAPGATCTCASRATSGGTAGASVPPSRPWPEVRDGRRLSAHVVRHMVHLHWLRLRPRSKVISMELDLTRLHSSRMRPPIDRSSRVYPGGGGGFGGRSITFPSWGEGGQWSFLPGGWGWVGEQVWPGGGDQVWPGGGGGGGGRVDQVWPGDGDLSPHLGRHPPPWSDLVTYPPPRSPPPPSDHVTYPMMYCMSPPPKVEQKLFTVDLDWDQSKFSLRIGTGLMQRKLTSMTNGLFTLEGTVTETDQTDNNWIVWNYSYCWRTETDANFHWVSYTFCRYLYRSPCRVLWWNHSNE